MSVSVFELFKVGIGPSSSHTVGPMIAAADFVESLAQRTPLSEVDRLEIELYGSLSATGVGHGTDHSVIMGLMGYRPDSIDPEIIPGAIAALRSLDILKLNNEVAVPFVWKRDLKFFDEPLAYHPNALRLMAWDKEANALYQNTYYSVGGGFVIDDAEATRDAFLVPQVNYPYPFSKASELLELCQANQMSISELVMENEKVLRSSEEITEGILDLWGVMRECIANGLHGQGVLPGGLDVKRRAMSLHKSLIRSARPNIISSSLSAMDWVNLYALAVNEENAGGGRMVTAPTNGAAGIIPAVLMYFSEFTHNAREDQIVDFFLTASAVGALCKTNASISGAEVGCQGEVGSACAMAAAGLCAVLGGTPEQVENAAEIGLEHNLGLTCDPVGGLVQVPCIERNAIAAMKSINAAQMALRGDGSHFISLDKVIRTMRDTGRDMQDKYKETSKGGLAVNAIEC